jgi:hypothetical protein
MSNIVVVWYPPAPVTVTEALEAVNHYEAGMTDALMPSDRLIDLHAALLAEFPEIAPVQASAALVELELAEAEEEQVKPVLARLANELDLAWYDYGGGEMHLPPRLTENTAGVRMRSTDGSLVVEPQLAQIQALLTRLNRHNWFAILERADGRFIQVGRWKDSPNWGLEYQDGSVAEHYRCEVDSLDGLDEVFWAFARGDDSWRASFVWVRLKLAVTGTTIPTLSHQYVDTAPGPELRAALLTTIHEGIDHVLTTAHFRTRAGSTTHRRTTVDGSQTIRHFTNLRSGAARDVRYGPQIDLNFPQLNAELQNYGYPFRADAKRPFTESIWVGFFLGTSSSWHIATIADLEKLLRSRIVPALTNEVLPALDAIQTIDGFAAMPPDLARRIFGAGRRRYESWAMAKLMVGDVDGALEVLDRHFPVDSEGANKVVGLRREALRRAGA